MNCTNELGVRQGIIDGFPVLLGYFSTAIAFGLLCRGINITLFSSVLMSLTSFAGSGQFLTINLYSTGTLMLELFISVMLINFRYVFMGISINNKLPQDITFLQRCLIAFGTTDEIFTIATLKTQTLNFPYLFSMELTAYSGWVSGTLIGYLLGTMLSSSLQAAMGVTLYAMFASLWSNEVRKNGVPVLIIGGISALINTFLVCICSLSAGWSFVIAMISASFIGSYIVRKE
ncbi:MAG: AzlC family ABC transporter permease [Spirochaetaceae bacterium]|nr:AzlC family ABC transporter permease [Spirochaetaceae bacterium]